MMEKIIRTLDKILKTKLRQPMRNQRKVKILISHQLNLKSHTKKRPKFPNRR